MKEYVKAGAISFALTMAVIFAIVLTLSVVHAGTLPADLTWTNPDTVDSIQIQKGAALAGPFNTLVVRPAATTGYSDATNAPGDTVCYRVAYVNTAGVGAYAGPVCKTFPDPPPAQIPAGLAVQ